MCLAGLPISREVIKAYINCKIEQANEDRDELIVLSNEHLELE